MKLRRKSTNLGEREDTFSVSDNFLKFGQKNLPIHHVPRDLVLFESNLGIVWSMLVDRQCQLLEISSVESPEVFYDDPGILEWH